jgi:hypothetical protein
MTDAVLEERQPYQCKEPEHPRFTVAERLLKARNSPRTRPQTSTALQQAVNSQRIAHRVVCALEADLDSAKDADSRREVAIAIRSAIQAWDLACDRVRIAQNRPLPGSLRPESKPRAKAKPQTVSFGEAPAPVSEPKPADVPATDLGKT